jgi:hypothetical protein
MNPKKQPPGTKHINDIRYYVLSVKPLSRPSVALWIIFFGLS